MKKAFVFIISCILSLTLLCACNNSLNRKDIVIDLTEDEIIDFYNYGKIYPENFIFEELQGYGSVIESATSREDAIHFATEHFNSGGWTTVECRLEVETDLFYGLCVKRGYRSGGVGEITSYYDNYVVSFKKYVYDSENKQFFTKKADIIKSILNYSCYAFEYMSLKYSFFARKVYSSDIIKDGNKYKYIAYGLTGKYVESGVLYELNFLKLVVEIDIATGKTSDKVETVKSIHGPFTNF